MRREQAGEKFSMPGARRNRKAEEKEAGGPLKANREISPFFGEISLSVYPG